MSGAGPRPRGADVIVPVYADLELTRRCLEAVLARSGEALERLILVDDCGPDDELPRLLAALRRRDARVRLVRNEANLGFVRSCNRGLALRSGDAVVLNSDTVVTEGWLAELLGVLRADPRVGAVCPLSNNATLCSVPRYGEGVPSARLEAILAAEPQALAALPRWTELPTGVGFCLALRGDLLDALGPFDPAYGRGYHEENDWCQRIQAAGYTVVRANRAVVFHLGGASFGEARKVLDAHNVRRLVRRAPHYLDQTAAFEQGLAARGVANALAVREGPLRVCLDVSALRPRGLAQARLGPAAPRAQDESPGGTPEGRYVRRVVESVLAEGRAPSARAASGHLVVRVRGGGAWLPSDVPCLPEDAPLVGYDAIHCLGVPGREALVELLCCEAALAFTPVDLAALATPCAHPSWALTEAERAHAWALCHASGAVLAPEPAMRDWLQRWLGDAPSVPVGLLPELSYPAPSGVRGGEARPDYLLHLGGDAPWRGLQRLLDAWALLSGASAQVELVLLGPSASIPDGPHARPGSWPRGVRRARAPEEPGAFEALVAGARAVIELSTVPGIDADLHLARALGTPVLSFPLMTPEALAERLDTFITEGARARASSARLVPSAATNGAERGSPWQALYRQLVRGAVDPASRRPLAALLSRRAGAAAPRRRHSSQARR